jgi:hypothetical protein
LLTGDTSPESEIIKKEKKRKKSVCACFQSPKVREKKSEKIARFIHVVFIV